MSVRRAAIWSLAAQYATFAIQFIASVIISRFFLLPADIGLFSIALASALVAAIFQDMGITRFISGQPEMKREWVPHYAAVAVTLGWLVAGAVAVAAPFVADFYGEPQLANLLWLIENRRADPGHARAPPPADRPSNNREGASFSEFLLNI